MMNNFVSNVFAAALLAASVNATAAVTSNRGTIIVDQPTDLPEAAQMATTAMYLHPASDGAVVLYLEQNQGRRLAVLDVTDPARIRTIGEATIDAKAPFDFVEDLSDQAALIRYRDNAELAVLNLKNYRHPVLTAETGLGQDGNFESLGATAMLTSAGFAAPMQRAASYHVVDLSAPAGPATLATVEAVQQRVSRPETGTLFLLNADGLTVVRRVRVEQEYKANNVEMNHN